MRMSFVGIMSLNSGFDSATEWTLWRTGSLLRNMTFLADARADDVRPVRARVLVHDDRIARRRRALVIFESRLDPDESVLELSVFDQYRFVRGRRARGRWCMCRY